MIGPIPAARSVSTVPTCLGESLMVVSLDDDAIDELDLMLGQTHHLLGETGDELAQRLVQAAKLTLRRDGGYFHPIPGDNWRADTYEAVFEVAPSLVPEFTSEITDRIWNELEPVLRQHDRQDVFGIVVEPTVSPLPDVAADWRARAGAARSDRAAEQSGTAGASRRWLPGVGWAHVRQSGRDSGVRVARRAPAGVLPAPSHRGDAPAGSQAARRRGAYP
jgi:hypothetical protein